MKKLLLIVGCLFGREFDLEIQQTINFRTQDIYQNINVFDENKYIFQFPDISHNHLLSCRHRKILRKIRAEYMEG